MTRQGMWMFMVFGCISCAPQPEGKPSELAHIDETVSYEGETSGGAVPSVSSDAAEFVRPDGEYMDCKVCVPLSVQTCQCSAEARTRR
jgi:hypothetical protein